MAFQRRGQHDQLYIADTVADLQNLPKQSMGSTCYVIETAEKYMVNSKGEWILQTLSTNGKGQSSGGNNNNGSSDNIDLSKYATIVYSDTEDKKVLDHSNAQDEIIIEQINNIEPESTVWQKIGE